MPPTAMWTIDPHTDLHTNTLMILCKTWFCVSPIHTTLILECVVVSEIQTTVRPVIIVLVLMWVILRRRIVWVMMTKIPSLIDWLMLHCGAISGAISGGLGWILTSLAGVIGILSVLIRKLPFKHSIDFCFELLKGTKCCVEAVLSPWVLKSSWFPLKNPHQESCW